MKHNLKDSILNEKEKEEFLTKVEEFMDVFSLRDEIGTCKTLSNERRTEESHTKRNG